MGEFASGDLHPSISGADRAGGVPVVAAGPPGGAVGVPDGVGEECRGRGVVGPDPGVSVCGSPGGGLQPVAGVG